MRADLGVAGFAVGTFGRLVPEKGLDVLFDAANTGADVDFHVFGSGPLLEQYRKQAGKVKVHGFREDALYFVDNRRVYGDSDVGRFFASFDPRADCLVVKLPAERVEQRRHVRIQPIDVRQAAAEQPIVGEVRGKGLMVGVECVEPHTHRPAPGVAAQIMEAARRGGVLVGKGGLYGNVLRIAPPLSITDDEADQGLRAVTEAVREAGSQEQ